MFPGVWVGRIEYIYKACVWFAKEQNTRQKGGAAQWKIKKKGGRGIVKKEKKNIVALKKIICEQEK